MFPVLLDDQSLFTEFGKFIESVDDIHELALDGQQQFPVLKSSTELFCRILFVIFFEQEILFL